MSRYAGDAPIRITLQLGVFCFNHQGYRIITRCQVSSSEKFINRSGLLLLITAGISACSVQASLILAWNERRDEPGYRPSFYQRKEGSGGISLCFF